MLGRLREQTGTAGLIVAVVALIAALAGAAYAASGLNSKQKKEVKSIAKSFQGTGPAGAQGPAGAAGAKGDKGDKGDTGANGKSVTVSAIIAGGSKCEGRAGAEVKQEGAGSGVPVCDGEEGSLWTAGGTLPVTSTETGVWALVTSQANTQEAGPFHITRVPISFTIPLASALDGAHTHFVILKVQNDEIGPGAGELCEGKTGIELEECEEGFEEIQAACPGSTANPLAASGHLCIYETAEDPESEPFPFGAIKGAEGSLGTGKTGALLWINVTGTFANTAGSWAVTG